MFDAGGVPKAPDCPNAGNGVAGFSDEPSPNVLAGVLGFTDPGGPLFVAIPPAVLGFEPKSPVDGKGCWFGAWPAGAMLNMFPWKPAKPFPLGCWFGVVSMFANGFDGAGAEVKLKDWPPGAAPNANGVEPWEDWFGGPAPGKLWDSTAESPFVGGGCCGVELDETILGSMELKGAEGCG